MSDGLDINTSFFANRGVIGRRDFVLNMMYLGIITNMFSIPFLSWMSLNVKDSSEFLQLNNLVSHAPFFHMVLLWVGAAFSIVFGISNIKRRITDIAGKEENISKYIISLIWCLASCWMLFPLPVVAFVGSLAFFVLLFLYFKKGVITSQLPYDVTKDFNIGAFLGSAIWGIANKVYQPLWMLLLAFTPFCLFFAFICGLKGNEWYFKKHKDVDMKKFKKSQKTQAWIFFGLSIPSIIALIFGMIALIGAFIFTMAAQTPEIIKFTQNNVVKMEKMAAEMEQMLIDKYFVSYRIYGSKNVFYINDSAWKNASFDERVKLFDIAAKMAAEKRNHNSANPNIQVDKNTELPKTKLYSIKTKELIGEYSADISASEISAAGLKAHLLGYKFYNITK